MYIYFVKKITVGNITLWPNNLCRSKNLMFKMVVFKKYKVFKKRRFNCKQNKEAIRAHPSRTLTYLSASSSINHRQFPKLGFSYKMIFWWSEKRRDQRGDTSSLADMIENSETPQHAHKSIAIGGVKFTFSH